jgi:tyrosyl-tRNA synthetase
MKSRDEFVARFSKRSFGEVGDLPTIADLTLPVTEVVKALGFAKSNGDVRRVAQQKGLRLVVEAVDDNVQVILSAEDARQPLAAVIKDKIDGRTGDVYLKVGRMLARIISTA